MNIHLMLTDLWFYTTLLLALLWLILIGLLLYAIRKVSPMLKGKQKFVAPGEKDLPVPGSTLRQRLRNDTSNN